MVLSGWRRWANRYDMGGLGLLGWCFGSLGVGCCNGLVSWVGQMDRRPGIKWCGVWQLFGSWFLGIGSWVLGPGY